MLRCSACSQRTPDPNPDPELDPNPDLDQVLGSLAAYTSAHEPAGRGLWESEHPWSQVLREYDRDYKGNFVVGDGFSVCVTAAMDRDTFRDKLLTALPNIDERFQAIEIRRTPGM